jgi:hypothetical protein
MTKADVENLQNIQRHLRKRGLHFSQQILLGKIIKYITENELDFIENIDKIKKKNEDVLVNWLDEQVEGVLSDALSEHDEVN